MLNPNPEVHGPDLRFAVSVRGGTLCPVNIEIPLFVLKLGGKVKPRYLVFQYEMRGAMNTPTLVYADVFYRRSDAAKAVKSANDRLFKIGRSYSIGKRRPADIIKLPIDAR